MKSRLCKWCHGYHHDPPEAWESCSANRPMPPFLGPCSRCGKNTLTLWDAKRMYCIECDWIGATLSKEGDT